MWFTVRLWPIDLDNSVPVEAIEPPPLEGSAGAGAPWRHEPGYWNGLRTLEAAGHPEPDETTIMWTFDLSLEQVRALDAEFRTADPAIHDDVMDRALAEGTPWKSFRFHVAEWP